MLGALDDRRSREPDEHSARLFGLFYPSGRPDLEDLVAGVDERFRYGNALNPLRFPEVAKLEHEVVEAVAELLHHRPYDRLAGTMTSGGTESILMSMLVHRERARGRGVGRPEILVPYSAHPAYAKAAHYFDMDVIPVPLTVDRVADVDAARSLITERTAVVVASAPCYPYGLVDPVPELAALAASSGAGCHVDACIGGFVLPFLERLGHPVPPWDFRVEGVTAISADVHKYGYMPKGASVIVHRDEDWFFHQVFFYDRWPSGTYAAPAVPGARPVVPVATAWAVIDYLGLEGYTEIVRGLAATVAEVRAGLTAHEGIEVVGQPIGPVLALRSDTVDLHAVADAMEERGWYLNRNIEPKGLQLMLSPAHADVVTQLLSDFADAVTDHGPGRAAEVRYA